MCHSLPRFSILIIFSSVLFCLGNLPPSNLLYQDSTWNTASVGKLSVTLRKKWPRKWPRLLQNKAEKINNMHVWMETQDIRSIYPLGYASHSIGIPLRVAVIQAALRRVFCSLAYQHNACLVLLGGTIRTLSCKSLRSCLMVRFTCMLFSSLVHTKLFVTICVYTALCR